MEQPIARIEFDHRTRRSRLRKALEKDPLHKIKRAAAEWNRNLCKSLHQFCEKLKFSFFGELRSEVERQQIEKWEFCADFPEDICEGTSLFTPKDLQVVLLNLRGAPQCNAHSTWQYKVAFALPAVEKDIGELWRSLAELNSLNNCQKEFPQHSELEVNEILKILRKGKTQPEYRGIYWAKVLNCQVGDTYAHHWKVLSNDVLNTKHILDALICKDVQKSAQNSNQYFVFVDLIYQVMLCFSRDATIAKHLKFEKYPVKGKPYKPPPVGVVPILGTCLFAAPFCYVYNAPINLYFTFRAFYIRYCHRWTTINTHPQGLFSLCLLVERLLQQLEPEIWMHLCELETEPITIIVKWLIRGFSGRLQPDQLLTLWDLIIGYDCPEILSLLAFGILSFRKDQLLQATDLKSVSNVVKDLTEVKVLPILKMVLTKYIKQK